MTAIFRHSLETSRFPRSWLHANVVPIFKEGAKCLAKNYRPVQGHLDKHEILSWFQHGFCSSYSCEIQLLMASHDLLSIRDKGPQVDIAVLDFSKAFGKVPQRRILSKLHLYDIDGPICNWIETFLSDRTQRVHVEGQYSRDARVTSRIPQGTVMGPLLFL